MLLGHVSEINPSLQLKRRIWGMQGVELAQERRKACADLIEEGLAVLGGSPASRCSGWTLASGLNF